MPWVAVTLQCIGNTFERKVGLARIDIINFKSCSNFQWIQTNNLHPTFVPNTTEFESQKKPHVLHKTSAHWAQSYFCLLACTVQTCPGWAKHNITDHCPGLRGDKTQTVCFITARNEGAQGFCAFIIERETKLSTFQPVLQVLSWSNKHLKRKMCQTLFYQNSEPTYV